MKSLFKSVDKTVDKIAELARVLGLSVRGIEYAMGTLNKAKRIRKVGGKLFGHWEVCE